MRGNLHVRFGGRVIVASYTLYPKGKDFNHGTGTRSNYTPNVDLAFISVEHIMRDVNYG